MNVKVILASAAAISVALAMAGAAFAADTNTGSDQNLRYTRAYLDRADDMLSHDQRDYGGHRAAAMNDIDQARGDLTSALQFDKNPDDAVKPTDVRPDDSDISNIMRGQRASNENIDDVKAIVERSIAMLQTDAHDYGGFRVKAIAALQAARDQLADAISFRNAQSGGHESSGNESDENLRFTRAYLDHAVDMLSHDKADYGGHRVAAMNDINVARDDLTAALRFDKNPQDAVKPTDFRPEDNDIATFVRGQRASNENVEDVKTIVERSIAMLQNDAHDYGGFRAKAIGSLESARDQLADAISFREAHSGQESGATASDENLRFTRLYVDRAVDMLQHDQHDYAGHRVNAISDLQSAQADLAQALKLDAAKEDSMLPAHMRPEDNDLDNFFQRGQFTSDQNIAFVRRTVERAIDMLQADQHDYNGFRVKAIDNLEKARQQLLLALQSR